MPNEQTASLDLNRAHKHFSAECFNRAWTLIEKANRSEADNEAMVLCAVASLWHWMQRADRTDQNLSVGHWQVSRVYALVGQGDNAMRHARRSLELAVGSSPYYVGYAHEAAARAAALLGDQSAVNTHLEQAKSLAAAVADGGERAVLENDLRELAASQR